MYIEASNDDLAVTSYDLYCVKVSDIAIILPNV